MVSPQSFLRELLINCGERCWEAEKGVRWNLGQVWGKEGRLPEGVVSVLYVKNQCSAAAFVDALSDGEFITRMDCL